MVECMIRECGFDYNSLIGDKELKECTRKQLIESYTDCDQECLHDLTRFKDNFNTMKVEDLFQL